MLFATSVKYANGVNPSLTGCAQRNILVGMTIDVVELGTEPDLSKEAADNIAALLGRKRMSQSEVARRLGVSTTWMSLRMTGRQEIGLRDLQRIAAILEVSPATLVTTRQLSPVRSRPVDRPTNRHDSTRPTPTGGRRNVVLRKAAA